MIDVQEHFYDDDPGQGHPDVRTRLKDAFYFFLGNGLIQAAVQIAPSGEGTPLGLLIMNPERLAKKREALTMSPESGLEDTMVEILSANRAWTCRESAVDAHWSRDHRIPAVRARWRNPIFEVNEFFYCPELDKPLLAREVRVKNLKKKSVTVAISTGCLGYFVGKKIALRGGEEKKVFFRYTLDRSKNRVRLFLKPELKLQPNVFHFWEKAAEVISDSPLLNHYFSAARSQLPAVISKSGRVDGSIWQYNREWVRDQAMLAIGLTLSGFHGKARVILERLISEFVTDDGQTIDSSEIRQLEEVELDQNGALLHALKHYILWTGDVSLITKNWEKVRATADYPLQPAFRHVPSGLLANTREYWERHRAFGIQKGIELAHQVFVTIGLADAAWFARLVGRERDALRWEAEAGRLKQACLKDRHYSLVEKGRLIKRRSVDGCVQNSIQALPEARLPSGVPLALKKAHRLNPDTSTMLPIAFEFVPAHSSLAKNTMKAVELLWNQAWDGGGYGRYHVSSEPDSPGPWPFPSLFVARAYAEMSEGEKVWPILKWLNTLPGAQSGAWFEFYGKRLAPPFPQVGVIPWTWAEIIILIVHHILGIRPQPDCLLIRPKLLPGIRKIKASFPLRNARLFVEIEADSRKDSLLVTSNSRVLRVSKTEAALAYSKRDILAKILIPLTG